MILFRRYFFWSAFIVSMALGLISCRSVSRLNIQEHPVFLTNEKKISLLNPSEIEFSLDALQRVKGRYGDSEFEFDAWIKATDSLVSIHIFNAWGGTFAEVFYTKDSLYFASRFLDIEKQKPEYVIADFQLCYYLPSALKTVMTAQGFEFDVFREDDAEYRFLKDHGQVIITVKKTPSELHYINYLRGYEYRIFSENS